MIRPIVVLLLMLLLAGWLGTLIYQDAGYVMLAYKQYSVEMSVWTLLFLALILYPMVALIMRMLRFLLGVVAGVRK